MPIREVLLPKKVRQYLGQQELRQIYTGAKRRFSERRLKGEFRMSEASTVTLLGDLLNPEQKPYAVKDIEGLHSVTGEVEGRGAAMETLAQLEGLGITERFGGPVKEKFR